MPDEAKHPPGVWPPQPIDNSPAPDADSDIRAFQYQNGWILALLLLVTAGLYRAIWMIKFAKTYNKLVPNKQISVALPYVLLWALAINLLSYGVIEAFLKVRYPISSFVINIDNAFSYCIGIYMLVIAFVCRGALNTVIEKTSPSLRYFGVLGTLFLDVLYLQITLNRRIRELEKQVFDREQLRGNST
jgi:hypothetical protein